ncbi:hypothetical protein SAMN05660284_00194 [Formivibrio citricus]|uniref:Uncharacterized protein n=1 Tax=Formivibrio citricus TaxID=83765 RepID=A0A1I4VA96_9NEIS|nr:hypothetical protein SAMN05660284_00194 [Formivibrio citricus]
MQKIQGAIKNKHTIQRKFSSLMNIFIIVNYQNMPWLSRLPLQSFCDLIFKLEKLITFIEKTIYATHDFLQIEKLRRLNANQINIHRDTIKP